MDTACYCLLLPNTTLLQRSAQTAVMAGLCTHGLDLRNGPRTCVVPWMIFAVRRSGDLVDRRGGIVPLVLTVVVVTVVPVVIVMVMTLVTLGVVVVTLVVVVLVLIVVQVIRVVQVRHDPQYRGLGVPKMHALGGLEDDGVLLDLDHDGVEARGKQHPAAGLDRALQRGCLPALPALGHDHQGVEDHEDQHWQQDAHEQTFRAVCRANASAATCAGRKTVRPPRPRREVYALRLLALRVVDVFEQGGRGDRPERTDRWH
jgi:hypothetical protein